MDPDPDLSGSDHEFWPIRIRTQKKNSDPDTEKNRIRKTEIFKRLQQFIETKQKAGCFPSVLVCNELFLWPRELPEQPGHDEHGEQHAAGPQHAEHVSHLHLPVVVSPGLIDWLRDCYIWLVQSDLINLWWDCRTLTCWTGKSSIPPWSERGVLEIFSRFDWLMARLWH